MVNSHEYMAEVIDIDDLYERIHHKSRRIASAAIHEAQSTMEAQDQTVVELHIKEELGDIVA